MLKLSHSTTNSVILSQDWPSMAPPLRMGLLAMKPTVRPSSRASTVSRVRPKRVRKVQGTAINHVSTPCAAAFPRSGQT
jgi:hypothetical protein